MAADLRELFEESLIAADLATPEKMEESEEKQFFYQVAHRADKIIEITDPEIDAETRWMISKQIAQYYRVGEDVVDAVRRWTSDEWQTSQRRDPKDKLIANPINAYLLLKWHPAVRGSIRLNLFTRAVEVCGGRLADAGREGIDAIVTAAQDWIYEIEECAIPFTDLGRRLVMVAAENAFDPIQDYLRGLKWDGVPRLHNWLAVYAGAVAEEPRYVEEVGMRWMLASVARAMEPGSKTDVVLITEGAQGARKSSLFEALGGSFYADAAIILGDKDSKMLASSAWIIELPEMASFKRSDQNALKAFFSTRVDHFRLPYGRSTVAVARRAVFVTTTNDDEYFSDPTGNRRYWPIRCGEILLGKLLRDRDQLWAEAYALYAESATCLDCARSTDTVWGQRARCAIHRWWLSKEMEAVTERECKKRQDIDIWTDAIARFAECPTREEMKGMSVVQIPVELTVANCLEYAIKKPLERCGMPDKTRVGHILRSLGYFPNKPHRGMRTYSKAAKEETAPKLAVVKK